MMHDLVREQIAPQQLLHHEPMLAHISFHVRARMAWAIAQNVSRLICRLATAPARIPRSSVVNLLIPDRFCLIQHAQHMPGTGLHLSRHGIYRQSGLIKLQGLSFSLRGPTLVRSMRVAARPGSLHNPLHMAGIRAQFSRYLVRRFS